MEPTPHDEIVAAVESGNSAQVVSWLSSGSLDANAAAVAPIIVPVLAPLRSTVVLEMSSYL
jgi:hypothetical protein